MKRYFILLTATILFVPAMGQNPLETFFTVNALTEDGRDTTFVVSSVKSISCSFIGGNGTVTNPKTGETMDVDNVDLYAYLDEVTSNSAIVKTVMNVDLFNAMMGYCLSMQPNQEPSESELFKDYMYLPSQTTETVNGLLFGVCSCSMTDMIERLADKTWKPETVFKLYSDGRFYLSFTNLEKNTTYYLRPFVIFNNYGIDRQVMFGGDTVFTTLDN